MTYHTPHSEGGKDGGNGFLVRCPSIALLAFPYTMKNYRRPVTETYRDREHILMILAVGKRPLGFSVRTKDASGP